ncbi:hypothetical protein K502DRAFT_368226 [Neoconidiobolus thromboides FSU 785]|nr:hypothetical protein K502DRAFT_368226 [Neoconidiobolus thromboides FSU 785]
MSEDIKDSNTDNLVDEVIGSLTQESENNNVENTVDQQNDLLNQEFEDYNIDILSNEETSSLTQIEDSNNSSLVYEENISLKQGTKSNDTGNLVDQANGQYPSPMNLEEVVNKYNDADEMKYDEEEYNYENLIRYPNFVEGFTIDASEGWDKILNEVDEKVVTQGIPLVIKNLHKLEGFDSKLFSLGWLKEKMKSTKVAVRDLKKKQDRFMTFTKFCESMERKKSCKSSPLLYGKDIEYPLEWKNKINKIIPSDLQYLGCNDLNSMNKNSIDNLMLYVGYEGTYTPAHFDICGSLGHNIMVSSENGSKALWFMIDTNNRRLARKFFAENGGGFYSLDQDNYCMPVHKILEMPFKVTLIEQSLGDFVLVPSLCAHQVVNIGKGANIKYSWNRNTAKSLKYAIREVNLINRRILKPEIYQTKRMVDYGINKMMRWMKKSKKNKIRAYCRDKLSNFVEDYKLLLELYCHSLRDEIKDDSIRSIKEIKPTVLAEDSYYEYNIVCDFCKSDIYLHYFHCGLCENEDEIGHEICIYCLGMGRVCKNMKSIQFKSVKNVEVVSQKTYDFISTLNNYLQKNGSNEVVLNEPYTNMIYKNDSNVHSTLTVALKNYSLLKGRNMHCKSCKEIHLGIDVVSCNKCKSKVCHKVLVTKENTDPYLISQLKEWHCFMCQEECNCEKCINKRILIKAKETGASKVFIYKDFTNIYSLTGGLTYYPIKFCPAIIPTYADYSSFSIPTKEFKRVFRPQFKIKNKNSNEDRDKEVERGKVGKEKIKEEKTREEQINEEAKQIEEARVSEEGIVIDEKMFEDGNGRDKAHTSKLNSQGKIEDRETEEIREVWRKKEVKITRKLYEALDGYEDDSELTSYEETSKEDVEYGSDISHTEVPKEEMTQKKRKL